MSNKNSGNALLLGMVFATEQRAKRGQEYRDRVRCEAMENIGFTVKTLDNKHADANLPKHCTANFSDTRRMMRSMDAKWSGEKFDHVILDYFFSPVRVVKVPGVLAEYNSYKTTEFCNHYRSAGRESAGRTLCSPTLCPRWLSPDTLPRDARSGCPTCSASKTR